MDSHYNTIGEIFGIAVATRLEESGRYVLVVPPEAWPQLQVLCTALQTLNGIEYTPELDQQIRLSIDTLAELRERAPHFGQLRLEVDR